ncbi:Bowman-Birk type trypsin inhibitor [Zea mays]|uniref:Bowman-Birk type trypsin inhibitor n=2 Tax=Zea mays TaxID=4577 RepID=A3FMA4_MAIZE|nr:putative Bowman-Birk serine protease inhibitor precursor [Zea mays]ABN54445.1 putative Bowman-Birk serine protease inhibitor [Zea mays]ACF84810.1 unknown [Zea mays]ACG33560.1 Bowman-Birk type trypsin inhibitor [Zea mays]AQK42538.1 Bowman-Birk type trypsin inhibitor [Zea mays]PWZ43865.1 Bowman-Birk type trypsin inhibitor [Zea mays]|eukprot:NP_001105984.1 putative Bowman-Birk serine protease inhibitor precursor [Zea mays]
MRPQLILVGTLAVLAILAALGEGSSSWPCCNNCGACNKKQPPECQCNDVSVNGCHPECMNCVKVGAGIRPGMGHGPVVTYRCDDVLTNFCQSSCPEAPAP